MQVQKKSWKIWVENRVEKIRSNEPVDSWRYIRTDQNPADITTRQVAPVCCWVICCGGKVLPY